MYHVELRGLEIESHKNSDVPYVSQSSVEIITAIAERATGRISDPATASHSSFAAPVLLADQDGHLLVDESEPPARDASRERSARKILMK